MKKMDNRYGCVDMQGFAVLPLVSSNKVAAGAVGGKILTDHISASSKKSSSGLHTTTIYSRSNYGSRVGKESRHMDIYKVDN